MPLGTECYWIDECGSNRLCQDGACAVWDGVSCPNRREDCNVGEDCRDGACYYIGYTTCSYSGECGNDYCCERTDDNFASPV